MIQMKWQAQFLLEVDRENIGIYILSSADLAFWNLNG